MLLHCIGCSTFCTYTVLHSVSTCSVLFSEDSACTSSRVLWVASRIYVKFFSSNLSKSSSNVSAIAEESYEMLAFDGIMYV